MGKSIPIWFLAGLGCASTPAPRYGNFIASKPAVDQRLARDAAAKIGQLYLPAQTTFVLQHPTRDPFGALLLQTLRKRGYAIAEFSASPSTKLRPERAEGIALRYIVDELGSSELIRISLQIGNHTLSRAYDSKPFRIRPAGAWVRKK